MIDKMKTHNLIKVSPWILFYSLVIGTVVLLNNGIIILRTLGFVIIFTISIFLRPDYLLMLIVVVEPLSILFKFNGNYTIMPFLFVVLFVKLLFKNSKMTAKKIIPLIVLMSIGLMNYIVREYSLIAYLSFFFPFLCFILISDDRNFLSENVYSNIICLYVFSVLLECILSGMFPNVVKAVTTTSQYNLRNIGFSSEWDFGRHILTATAFMVYWILKYKRNIIISSIIIVYLVYALIGTGLYSGLVALVVLLLMIPFTVDGTLKRRITYIIIASIFAVIGLIAAYYLIYLPMFALRGQISNNGRFELWHLYYNDFISNPSITLFGIGAGAIMEYAAAVGRLTTHNTIIEKVFEFGIIGICLLVYLLRACFSKKDLMIRKNLRLLPLITFLGTCLTQGVSGSELFFILMILSL